MTREQLINAVKVRMDNITEDGSIEVVGNSNVEYLLDEQLSNAFMYLPNYVLPQSSFLGASGVGVVEGVARVQLPADFLRLVRYRTDKMKRSLTEGDLVKEGSPEHTMMYGKFTGGGTARPKGCICYYHDMSAKVLEHSISSLDAGTAVEAQYIAIPTYASVTSEILDPVAWFIAYGVLGSMGATEAAKHAMSKAQEYVTLKQ